METLSHDIKSSTRTGTLFIKDVDRLDCATFDPSVGITGKSWYVDVEITGELDDNGFVFDFSLLKKLVKNTLKQSIDHALLIPIQSKSVGFEGHGDSEHWTLTTKSKFSGEKTTWTYDCPKGAVYTIRSLRVTRESIEQEAAKLVRHRLPETVHRVKIRLRKEGGDPNAVYFRYTHGISGHEGLCQRLFHGHRSLVEVYVAGEKRPDLERFIAHDMFSSIIHIASLDQVVGNEFNAGQKYTDDRSVCLNYEGTFGSYSASIPVRRVFFVKQHTSIEAIASEVASYLKAKFEIQAPLRVHCYEGIDKGAIAEV